MPQLLYTAKTSLNGYTLIKFVWRAPEYSALPRIDAPSVRYYTSGPGKQTLLILRPNSAAPIRFYLNDTAFVEREMEGWNLCN
jgi:hypothetical protein